jgi:hypothetical protein
MKFKITTTGWSYSKEDVKLLTQLGFKFDKANTQGMYLIDNKIPEIEINTLEELLELSNNFGQLIVDAVDETIEIYDNWRE